MTIFAFVCCTVLDLDPKPSEQWSPTMTTIPELSGSFCIRDGYDADFLRRGKAGISPFKIFSEHSLTSVLFPTRFRAKKLRLVVTGGDSGSRGHEFESQHQILDGHFSHLL